MTIEQFKSWFQGYIENITHTPTPEQWARIKQCVDEIDPSARPPIFTEYQPMPSPVQCVPVSLTGNTSNYSAVREDALLVQRRSK